MTAEEIKETIDQAIREAIEKAFPKEWLTKAEVMKEFGISGVTIYRATIAQRNPLPFSTFGDRRQLFSREDIKKYLNANKRNVKTL